MDDLRDLSQKIYCQLMYLWKTLQGTSSSCLRLAQILTNLEKAVFLAGLKMHLSWDVDIHCGSVFKPFRLLAEYELGMVYIFNYLFWILHMCYHLRKNNPR